MYKWELVAAVGPDNYTFPLTKGIYSVGRHRRNTIPVEMAPPGLLAEHTHFQLFVTSTENVYITTNHCDVEKNGEPITADLTEIRFGDLIGIAKQGIAGEKIIFSLIELQHPLPTPERRSSAVLPKRQQQSVRTSLKLATVKAVQGHSNDPTAAITETLLKIESNKSDTYYEPATQVYTTAPKAGPTVGHVVPHNHKMIGTGMDGATSFRGGITVRSHILDICKPEPKDTVNTITSPQIYPGDRKVHGDEVNNTASDLLLENEYRSMATQVFGSRSTSQIATLLYHEDAKSEMSALSAQTKRKLTGLNVLFESSDDDDPRSVTQFNSSPKRLKIVDYSDNESGKSQNDDLYDVNKKPKLDDNQSRQSDTTLEQLFESKTNDLTFTTVRNDYRREEEPHRNRLISDYFLAKKRGSSQVNMNPVTKKPKLSMDRFYNSNVVETQPIDSAGTSESHDVSHNTDEALPTSDEGEQLFDAQKHARKIAMKAVSLQRGTIPHEEIGCPYKIIQVTGDKRCREFQPNAVNPNYVTRINKHTTKATHKQTYQKQTKPVRPIVVILDNLLSWFGQCPYCNAMIDAFFSQHIEHHFLNGSTYETRKWDHPALERFIAKKTGLIEKGTLLTGQLFFNSVLMRPKDDDKNVYAEYLDYMKRKMKPLMHRIHFKTTKNDINEEFISKLVIYCNGINGDILVYVTDDNISKCTKAFKDKRYGAADIINCGKFALSVVSYIRCTNKVVGDKVMLLLKHNTIDFLTARKSNVINK